LHPFEYVEAQTVEEAVGLLSDSSDGAQPVAGGTDLLDEIKEGVASPERLVNLARIPGLDGVTETDEGVSIGAMTTIADIAAHPIVLSQFTVLAQAAAGLATPQIRNVGTLGGNLNQRPRCWYYRHPLTRCLKKGGDHCYALAGNSKYLCVTGGDRCYIVHPSDTAVALTALDARIEIAGPGSAQTVPIDEFFLSPSQNITRENILTQGEIVTRVHLDRPVQPSGGQSSLYLKAREKESGDFALISVAAVINVEGNVVRRAAVSLGGVAPVPYRAGLVDQYLQGRPVAEIDPAYAGSIALPDARPMADNSCKVTLAGNLVKRAITQLVGTF
jgi:xanthine dehydrogenase YagS FAD-binding subunit